MRNNLLILVVVIILVAIWWFSLRAPTADKEIVSLGKVNIPVEVSRTPTEWGQGLSGRKSLPAGEGMLFVFPAPAIQEFWMPDMHFPLDIVFKLVNCHQNIFGLSF